ncbi:YkgJ family cysteine cluster protein [Iodobacter sp. HSC-16F04]|uniref:YkgJ family cysteine cluster protein n=1 Tax=Iodobacter violaceini TaxID=3044271 RepID=A0ABX0KVR2_9NEIS|nr:YkgJ family cysteine cluster protein [Iodobacter violacea]NHQ86277.1 YkgJ family cysteine cluster protein [Iodobacter violacea]
MNDIYTRIHERKHTLAERIPKVMREIEDDFTHIQPAIEGKLQKVLLENGSRRSKLMKLHPLISQVREISEKHAACARGCNSCCFQRVMLSQIEADVIGQKIHRPARKLDARYRLPSIDSYGMHTPCVFLIDGLCSIYENRPFMCRNYVNLDIDSLLCGDENWDLHRSNDFRFTGIPTLDAGPLLVAYQKLSGLDATGDIRDFFPLLE